MSFETVGCTRDRRAALVALLARVGTTQLSDEEFAWWFDTNPAGERIVSLAVDGGEVVGVAAMSFFRTALDGTEVRLATPVNVATDPRYRGQGVFSRLEHENEKAAAAFGSPVTVTFPNGASHPIFVSRLGWTDLPRLRLRGGADALVLLPPPSRAQRRALLALGFAPTNKRLRFIGKALRGGAQLDERASGWHFTLGDFDFF